MTGTKMQCRVALVAAFDEAVVVTSTRVEEPLQQVPMSILGGDRG